MPELYRPFSRLFPPRDAPIYWWSPKPILDRLEDPATSAVPLDSRVGGHDDIFMEVPDPLQSFIGHDVVFDTDGPILYLGRLVEVAERGLVLADADVHDCRDGHASKEAYLAEALQHGITINRRRVVVARTIVMSVSRLADVVLETTDSGDDNLPDAADLLMEDE